MIPITDDTRIATIPEYAAMRGATVSKVESWVKQNRITTLRQHGKTVIDVELGSDRLRVSQPTTFEYKVNDSCLIEMNIERGHLFDPESETNVTRS